MDGLLKIKSGQIAVRIYRNFGINDTGIKSDIVEWIGECLGLIGTPMVLQHTSKVISIKNGRIKLPCLIDLLIGVEYKGCLLDRIDKVIEKYTEKNSQTRYWISYPYLNIDLINDENITVHYKTFPVDEEGYPYIPSLPSVLKAVEWYIMMMIMQRGTTHPTLNYAYVAQKSEKWMDMATNDLLMPSPEESGRIMARTRQITPDFDMTLDIYES